MCWMTGQQSNDGTALRSCVSRAQEHAAGNPHGWGVAYIEQSTGLLVIERGEGKMPNDFAPAKSDTAIAHTRFTTAGVNKQENSHPFPIHNADGEIVAAFAHNGTFYGVPRDSYKSDTRIIAERIERMVRADIDIVDAFEFVAGEHGETMLLLTADGTIRVFAGRFTITRSPEGDRVASSGFERITPGEIGTIPTKPKAGGD